MSRLLVGWPIGTGLPNVGSRFLGDRSKKKRFKRDFADAIAHEQDSHCLTIAPTGAGKGVSVIIPNLLVYTGSAIVIDPKAENLYITARYRSSELGQDIIIFDPFGSVREDLVPIKNFNRHRINPLQLSLDTGEFDETDAQALARLISAQSPTKSSSSGLKNDAFWDSMGHDLLSGIIFFVARSSQVQDRSIREIVSMLFDDDVDHMLASLLDNNEELRNEEMVFARRAFVSYLTAPEKDTRPSILATSRSYLNIFTGRKIRDYLSDSDLKADQYSRLSRPSTTYIIVPPEKLSSHAVITRLIIGTLIRVILNTHNRQKTPILFMLDECAQLGELDELRQAITLLRGYGLKVWMFFQDISQMKQHYKHDWRTLVNNCGLFQTFGLSYAQQKTELYRLLGGISSDDISSLGKTQQVVMVNGRAPVIAEKLSYLTDATLSARAVKNPLHVDPTYSRKI